MRLILSRRWFVTIAALPLALALLASGTSTWGADDAADKPTVKRQRAKAKGRLPTYYRQVVSPAQRQKIYTIQAKWADQIKALEKQLAELTAQRDTEVETILTPEQRERVAKLTAEAKAKRDKANQERQRLKAAAATTRPAKDVAE